MGKARGKVQRSLCATKLELEAIIIYNNGIILCNSNYILRFVLAGGEWGRRKGPVV